MLQSFDGAPFPLPFHINQKESPWTILTGCYLTANCHRKLSFVTLLLLDCAVLIHQDWKPTHTDLYMFFNSHYTMKHNLGVIGNLTHRAENVPSKAEG